MIPVYPQGTPEPRDTIRPVDHDDWDDGPDSIAVIAYRQRRAEDYARANGCGFSDPPTPAKAGWGR